ncbi:MAG: beta-N-acetylhexosaminidase [Bacteroidia bacterium]|nr:beta-N-acetylhexosaminidase [Bacteroidia bacterium]
MRASFIATLLALLLSCGSRTDKTIVPVAVIPQPMQLASTAGVMRWEDHVHVLARSQEEMDAAGLLAEFLSLRNIETEHVEDARGDVVRFTLSENTSLPDEGYKLTVNEKGANIEATTSAGLFYGAQTFIQLISENGTSVPYVRILDQPRFQYRGMHLDVGRNMFPPAFIKKYIALMAHYKFNTFHWHLTEDQGWRIEIKKYPELTAKGAFRKETAVGFASTRTRSTVKYDGKPYGGFYTQDEVKDIVAFAARHHVTIIPEIEMPGHAQAALASYPYLGCTGGPYEVATTWGVFDDVYCAGRETTFEFLQDVLDEVIELFPGNYIHIGGDECPKTKWKTCAACQQRIKQEKLKDEHELQSYFIRRIESYLNDKGRSMIGWDEILEGGLSPNATVMSWRGEEGGIAAAKQRHQVIMTPVEYCYFDYYQANPDGEPLAGGGFLPIDTVYAYDPLPQALTPDERAYILGVQGNVWSEYLTTPEHAEYMIFPRALAMSEVAWSQPARKDRLDFLNRLQHHKPLLDMWNVHYAPHGFTKVQGNTEGAQ